MRWQKFSKITAGAVAICLLAGLAFAAVGGGPYKLAYRMKTGQRLKYMMDRNTESSMVMQGREMNSTTNGKIFIHLDIEEVGKDGSITFVSMLDSVLLRANVPQMGDTTFKNPAELIGKRNRQVISAHGKKLKSAVVDTAKLTGMLAQIGSGLLSAFGLLELPEKGVKLGDSWTDTTPDTIKQMGNKIVIMPNLAYTVAGEVDTLGYKCLRLAYSGTNKIKGEGTNMGMNFFIEGEGPGKGTAYFALQDGLLVAKISEGDMEMTVALTGQMSMTISQSVSEKETTLLVK
ncbi:MAG: hypothetical protein ACREOI_14045 [bacterium]